ncbi:MAG: anti-sigma factor antagonist [Ruminococcus sp.]|nr:anti-sigma factor antagonist [Ruminococcus sp.]
MTIKMTESTNDKLVIAVSGKIDGMNSDEFKEQVKKIRDSHPDGDLVLDMDGLEYISSAGLRVILKFSKEEDDLLKLVNVSWDVMEIFSMTGFNEFINITKKMKEISVDPCGLLGKGANGEVYRIDDERIVKLFSETASIDVIQRERALSQKAMIYGLPTAISFDIVKCGNRYGAVFELLNAKTLSTTIKNDPSAFDTYADTYVDLYKKLHSTVVKKEDFPSIKEIYYDYIDDCKDWYTPEQLDTLRKIVDSIPDRDTLIHGDYHANNIMIVDGQLLLIDMGDLSFGHPIFDFLATAATQVNLVKLNPAFAEVHTNMPVDKITKLWSHLIDRYFADKSEEQRQRINEQIALFSKLKVALAPAVAKGLDPAIMKASVNDAIENFLSRADELIGSVDW